MKDTVRHIHIELVLQHLLIEGVLTLKPYKSWEGGVVKLTNCISEFLADKDINALHANLGDSAIVNPNSIFLHQNVPATQLVQLNAV